MCSGLVRWAYSRSRMARLSASDTPDDVRGEAGVDEHAPAPGLGVDADHGVLHRVQPRDDLAVPDAALAAAALGQVVAELAVAVVHGGELVGQLAHGRGQGLVGELAVGPARVAAGGGQDHGAQDRAERRTGHERDVGVPHVGEAVVGAVELVDLRMRLVHAADDGVGGGQLAEPPAESHLAVVVEVLPGEEQHLLSMSAARTATRSSSWAVGQVEPVDRGRRSAVRAGAA